MCTKTPTVAQLTYSNTLLCVWDPVSYFLSPGKTGEMKAALSDMSWTYQTQTLEELQRQLWFWASSLVSCFDELIQNPDLSHRQNVDPGLNWTLPVMCKFTSVSTINKSLSEWSLDRFSLISASLISPEKNFSFPKATSLFNLFALLCSHKKPFCGKSHTFQCENLANSFFSKRGAKKKKKDLMILFLTVLKSKCNMQRENLLAQSRHISGHLCSEQREDVQLVSLPQAPQLVSLWKIGEKFLYSSQYVNQTTGITVL